MEEIRFNRSMTANKRNPDFAYLRHNVLNSHSAGLYPMRDFIDTGVAYPAGSRIVCVVGTDEGAFDRKVLVENGGDLEVYNYGSGTLLATEPGVDVDACTFGEDGVYVALNDDTVRKVQHLNNNITNLGTFADSSPSLGAFDGINYYWFGRDIYRQAPGGAPVNVFPNVGFTPDQVAFYSNQVALFSQQGEDIYVFLWDKTSNTLFDRRVIVKNSRLLAGVEVDGRLMLIHSIGNRTNSKEREGEIVVSTFDGQNFVEQNSIKAGDDDVELTASGAYDVGRRYVVLAIDRNDNGQQDDLYKNWVLKISSDATIETLYEQVSDEINGVHVAYDFIALVDNDNNRILDDRDGSSNNFATYNGFTTTRYVTNFLTPPSLKGTLKSVRVAFEKIFNDEELIVSYRTSDREDFIPLYVINKAVIEGTDQYYDPALRTTEHGDDNVGIRQQHFDIVVDPSGENLPEFYEIQFKFDSLNGFSVTQAWYNYETITRHTT